MAPGDAGRWIDESARQAASGFVYAMAAVRFAGDEPAGGLEQIARLQLPGQRYLHRRDEHPSRRRKLIAVINELPLNVVVAVTEGVVRRDQEAARARCLVALAVELDDEDADRRPALAKSFTAALKSSAFLS